MAIIAPFRGYRFNPSVVGDLNKVVTLPYDKIDDALRDEYLGRNEYNIVRIIKGPPKPDDTPNDNPYTRAAGYWESWIEDRALVREAGPALYPYHQEYTIDGKTFVRKGLVALVRLDDDKSKIFSHESTLAGPKADRLKLMRATEANDGQIFMLYDDRENQIDRMLETETTGASPIMEVKDDYGAVHRLYRLTRPGAILDLSELFEKQNLFIADGHHRYETAVKYMNDCKERNWKPMGAESFNHRMMTLVNMSDPGLTILPTHRVIHSVAGFSYDDFLRRASEHFQIAEHGERASLYGALDDAAADGKTTIGFSADGLGGLRSLTLKDPSLMDDLVREDRSPEWKRLDVIVLHAALLERLLGIDAARLETESNVRYVRGRDAALDMVGSGGCQAAFIVNPTRIGQVRAVAEAGERMPQKSTDFFPKLLTGMVMMKMTNDKSIGLAVWEADMI